MFMFLSSHGSSLIGLPFLSLGCLPIVFVYVTCAVFWLHRHVQRSIRGDVCSILLPTMRSEIFDSLFSSIAVADERVLVVCHFLLHC